MKKQSLINGLITIVASMLLFSCSNNDAAKSDANIVSPYNMADTSTNAAADSLAKSKELVAGKDSITVKEEKEEKEENEKNEK